MIGYPVKKKYKDPKKQIGSQGDRGMSLEYDLNISNAYYRNNKRALIYKKPTPIQVVKVDYPARSAARISEAYYKTPSTTDYQGIYRSKAIDFEAKETGSKTSFPFSSIHKHQIEHLKAVLYHGGIGFLIIRFTCYNEDYILPAQVLLTYVEAKKHSISYADIKQYGIRIEESFNPRMRFLDAIDKYYFQEEN